MKLALDWALTLAEIGFSWLLLWSWQAAILIAGVWLGLKVSRPQSPKFRHQIWLLCLIAVAFFPIWTVLIQATPLPRPAGQTLSKLAAVPNSISQASTQQSAQGPSRLVESPNAAQSNKTTIISLSVAGLLFLAWIVGAVVVFFRIIRNHRRLSLICHAARPITLSDLDCGDLSGIEGVNLLSHERIRSPFLFGVWRPSILLPADFSEWTTSPERRAMLQHEFSHFIRRDHHVGFFLCILAVFFYFHPLVVFARRKLEIEREMACDDCVLEQGAQEDVYVEGILKAALRNATARKIHQIGVSSSKRILEKRIGMILNKDRARYVVNHKRKLILSTVLMALALWGLTPANSGPAPFGSDNRTASGEYEYYFPRVNVNLTDEQKEQLKLANRRMAEGLQPMMSIESEEVAEQFQNGQSFSLSSDGKYASSTPGSFVGGYVKNASPMASQLTFKTIGFDRSVTIALTEKQRQDFAETFHRSITELSFEPTLEMVSVYQSERGYRGALEKLKNTIRPDAYIVKFYSVPGEELRMEVDAQYRQHRYLGREWQVHNLWSLFYPNLYPARRSHPNFDIPLFMKSPRRKK